MSGMMTEYWANERIAQEVERAKTSPTTKVMAYVMLAVLTEMRDEYEAILNEHRDQLQQYAEMLKNE